MTILNLLAILILTIAFFLIAAFIFLIPVAFTMHSLITVAVVPVQLYRLAGSKRVRQNHALEHATINLLEERLGRLHLAGLSSNEGFIVFGPVDIRAVKDAASSGLSRLQHGQRALAIHRECGTGRGIVHLVSALVFLSLLLFSGHFSFLYIVVALLVSALLGPLLGRPAQVLLTTTTDLDKLFIENISPFQPDGNPMSFSEHPGIKVKTGLKSDQ